MPSGAQIITRVANTARMNAATGSADRVLVLGFVQEAVDQVSLDAEINTDPSQAVSLAAGTHTYNLTTSPFAVTDLISIQQIELTDGANTAVLLDRVTMGQVRDQQQGAGQANTTPYCYAVEYPTIVFYPTPGSGTTLNIDYVADGPTVADTSSALTLMPKAVQWGTLAEFAIALAKQYKQDPTWTQHMDRYQNDPVRGLPALRRWKSRVGGVMRPTTQYTMVVTDPSQDTGWGA